MFREAVETAQPRSLMKELYELLVSCRKGQIYQEYEYEKNSVVPVAVKSKDWLENNAKDIVVAYEADDVGKYIQKYGVEGIERLRMHVEKGVTFSGALAILECGAVLSSQELAAAGAVLEKKTKTPKQF